MKKVIIMLVVMLIAGAASAQQIPGSGYLINDEAYEEWVGMSYDEQVSYTWGVLSGAYALASLLDWETDSTHISSFVEKTLPSNWSVQNYIDMINYVYEIRATRAIPIWTVLFKMEDVIEMRREYGDK